MKSIKKKYDNKYLVVTGRKKIQIVKVMRYLADIFEYNKKIKYKNLEIEGHYSQEPKPFSPRKGMNLFINKYKDFKSELVKLIKERKLLLW